MKNVRDYMNGAGMKYKDPKYFKAQGKESAYDAQLNIIDSLQQEQPEPSNNLVDVDAVREDFMREVYRVLDADPTNDRANAIINAFDSLPTVSQEQPEISLEKITKLSLAKELPEGFDKEWLLFYHTDSEYNSKKFHHLSTIEREYIIARHFWNKGYNARKEDK